MAHDHIGHIGHNHIGGGMHHHHINVMIPPPQPTTQSTAAGTIVTVPIQLVSGSPGGMHFNSNAYSLSLSGVLSRQQFDEIVAQLNVVVEKYAPGGGFLCCMMLPCFICCTVPLLFSKMKVFYRELGNECTRLSSVYKGVNLRVVEAAGGRIQTLRVDMEVMV